MLDIFTSRTGEKGIACFPAATTAFFHCIRANTRARVHSHAGRALLWSLFDSSRVSHFRRMSGIQSVNLRFENTRRLTSRLLLRSGTDGLSLIPSISITDSAQTFYLQWVSLLPCICSYIYIIAIPTPDLGTPYAFFPCPRSGAGRIHYSVELLRLSVSLCRCRICWMSSRVWTWTCTRIWKRSAVLFDSPRTCMIWVGKKKEYSSCTQTWHFVRVTPELLIQRLTNGQALLALFHNTFPFKLGRNPNYSHASTVHIFEMYIRHEPPSGASIVNLSSGYHYCASIMYHHLS